MRIAGWYIKTVLLAGLLYSCFLAANSSFALSADPLANWHWRNPLPQGNSLTSVTYGGGKFVVVGAGRAILTSTDGVTWTTQTSQTADDLNGVAYGNRKFVAVGSSGSILTSKNGITWTAQTWQPLGIAYNLSGVAYGNGKFIAVGWHGTILTSTDGVTWKSQTLAIAYNLWGVTYGSGKFVSVGYGFDSEGSGYGLIATSTDGARWTSRPSVFLKGVTYKNLSFVAVGDGGAILTSPDAVTWTSRTSQLSDGFNTITYGNGMFVAAGDGVLTSTGGVTWKSQTSQPLYGLSGITYGNGTFIAVGGRNILASAGGATWTLQKSDSSYDLHGVTYGNGMFVAVGGNSAGTPSETNGMILTSTDGTAWTEQFFGNNDLQGVTYGNGKFVAVGYGFDSNNILGTILTSVDGIKWIPQSSGTSYLSGVTYGKGTFVAVGWLGTLSSTDGIKWTLQPSYGLYGAAYGNGTFVAVGYRGTILTSTDAIAWISLTSRTSNDLYGVTYGSGTFVAVGGGGTILQSDSFPDIKSAVTTTPEGHYKAGSRINIKLTFNKPVSSAGLTIRLNTGASVPTGALSNQTSYSGDHTVAAGQNAAALNISSIGGRITDAAGVIGRPVVPRGNNIAGSKKIVIDTTRPAVAISGPSTSNTINGPVTYTVTYADTNFNSGTLTVASVNLNRTGTANGVISSVTGAGNRRTVTISSITGSGTIGISIVAGTATDKAGNKAPAAGPSATFSVTP